MLITTSILIMMPFSIFHILRQYGFPFHVKVVTILSSLVTIALLCHTPAFLGFTLVAFTYAFAFDFPPTPPVIFASHFGFRCYQ